MSDATLVAVVILIGVFLLMTMTVVKAGVEGAIKMWSVMGALTGVAFGAITSYYFTNQVKNQEVVAVNAEKMNVEAQLAAATRDAASVRELVTPVYDLLRGDAKAAETFPVSAGLATKLPKEERTDLTDRFSKSDALLETIEMRGATAGIDAAGIVRASP